MLCCKTAVVVLKKAKQREAEESPMPRWIIEGKSDAKAQGPLFHYFQWKKLHNLVNTVF